MKQNDYIVASINNPDFSPAEFRNIAGLNLENTQMLTQDLYTKSKFIRENPLFADDSGNFSAQKFADFYQLKLKDFLEFALAGAIDDYLYSPFDTRRRPGDKIQPFGMTLSLVPNPERVSMGIVGPNKIGRRTMSDRELALREKVFDYEKGVYRDYTPNDKALTTNPFKWIALLFEEPLVLATYDESGTHFDPILGREVTHQKGLKKLNANGVPYYETLSNRSMMGKDALSVFDNMTVDGKGINKYDFFDSDGVDKSVPGTVAKTLVTFLPMMTPLSPYYAGALVVREMMKAAPMLYGIGSALFTDNTELPMLNKLAAIGNRFSTSTSDYAKDHTFSFENFGNLVSDVALLWGQQKFIVDAFRKVNKTSEAMVDAAKAKALNQYRAKANELLLSSRNGEISIKRVRNLTGAETKDGFENLIKSGDWEKTVYGRAAQDLFLTPIQDKLSKYARIGQDLSLGYMAIVSNTDVYETALRKGATKGEAALMALGSTVGMFSVDRFLGLGEMFFDYADPRYMFKASVRHEADKVAENLTKNIGTETAKGVTQQSQRKSLGKWFMAGIESGKKVAKMFESKAKERTLGFTGKAVGEGLEEVSEELVTDLTKSLFEIAGLYGWTSKKDYGAWENAGDRYLMSLLGGMVGGGLFYLKDPGILLKQAAQALHLLVRQGKALEVRDVLSEMYKKGLLGNTNLSYIIDEKENKPMFITADKDHKSQNDFVYNILNQSIDLLEEIMLHNRLNKTEDELFSDLVLADERFIRLAAELKDNSYVTGYLERYQLLVNRIVTMEQMKAEELSKGDSELDKHRVDELDEALNNARLERDKFFNGERSLDYMQKMLFAMSPLLYSGFAVVNVELYADAKGWDYRLLTGNAKDKMDLEWAEYSKNPLLKDDLDVAFRVFLNMQYKLLRKNDMGEVPLLKDIEMDLYLKWEEVVKLLEDYDPSVIKWDMDTRFDWEDDEDYEYRLRPMEGEDLSEFNLRVLDRLKIIDEHNSQWKTWIQQLVSLSPKMDSNVRRRFLAKMGQTSELLRKKIISKVVSDKVVLEALNGTPNPDLLREAVKKSIDKIVEDRWQLKANDVLGEDGEYFYFAELENLYDLFNVMSPLLGDKIDMAAIYDLLGGLDIREKIVELYNKTPRYNDLENVYQTPEELNSTITIEDLPELDLVNAYNLYVKSRLELEASEDYIESDESRRKHLLEELTKDLKFTDWREDYVEILKLKDKDTEYAERQAEVDDIINKLTTDPDLKLILDLENEVEINGPAENMVKVLAAALGSEQVDIQNGLETIHKIWVNLENPNDFELSTELEKYLKDSLLLIKIAKALVASTYMEANLAENERFAYNKTINLFVHDHSKAGEEAFKNFEELYTLDPHLGNSLMMSLELYEKEINQWMEVGKMNSDNKVNALWDTLAALTSSRVDVFKSVIRPNPDVPYMEELAEGFEAVANDRNKLESGFVIENLFHENVKNLLSLGVTTSLILDSLIHAIDDDDALISGITSKIDLDLTAASFTKYDQFMYLTALMAVDPIKYLLKEGKFITDNKLIAPIATQLPGMILGMAIDEHPEIVNEALDKLKGIATKKGLLIPVLYNTRVYTGLGGAGKSLVEAKFTVDPKEKTWIAGPTIDLANGLKNVIPTGEEMTIDLILQAILGNNKGKVLEDFTSGIGIDKRKTVVLNDLSSYFKTTNAPDHIVIDEATHIDNLTLQALGQFAKLTGAKITLLGDENLRGFELKKGKDLVLNIQREVVLAFRTPRLNISLRSGNVWKTYNLKLLTNLMDRLRASNELNGPAIAREVLEKLKDLNLSFYENEVTLNGDKLVPSLSDDDVRRLLILEQNALLLNPRATPVAFVGDVKSPTFTKLNSVLKNVRHIDPLNVLGQEFDYVVVDKDFDLITSDNPDGGGIMPYLLDIYTMITRSRHGSILIDRGQISKGILGKDGIKNKLEEYTTQSVNLNEEAIKDFSDNRKAFIEYILDKYKKKEESKEKPKEKKTTETPTEKAPAEEPPVGISPEAILLPESFEEEDPTLIVLPEDVEKVALELETTQEPPKIPERPKVNAPVLYRAYSNILFLGGATIGDKGEWTLNGVRRDIGIFGSRGDVIATDKKGKLELVRDLSALRAVFTFDMDMLNTFNILPRRVRDLFDVENFTPENVEYYVVAEDYDPNTHSLVGLTTAEDDKVSFIKGKDEHDKVISVLARIKSSGTPITITLGAVANPDKWLEYVNRNDDGLTNDELKIKQDLIENYRSELQKLVNKGEIKIKKPKFSGKTELLPVPISIENARGLVRNEIRLGALLEFDNNEWEDRTANMSVSPVFIVTGALEELNPTLSKNLKGKPVIFVSANPNLRSEDLYRMWQIQLKDRDNNTALVRMVVLHNAGVSFNSLYRRTFQEIYNRKTGSSEEFSLPVRLRHNAIRMFGALWNFRANLSLFNELVNELLKANNWTKEDLINYAKADEQYYNELKLELGVQYIGEDTYNNWLRNHTENPFVELIIKLREFNDSLADKVRQFRIGYSTKGGAYIRLLTNIKTDNPFYDKTDPNGIYINPELADLYTEFLTKLFDNVVYLFFPDAKKLDIDSLIEYNRVKGWANNLTGQGKVQLGVDDRVIEVTFGLQALVDAFPITLMNIVRNLYRKADIGLEEFITKYNDDKDPKYHVGYKLEGQPNVDIDYIDLDLAFEYLGKKGLLRNDDPTITNLPGYISYEHSEHGDTGYIDKRLDNMFDLIFHGIVAQPAAHYNDFNYSLLTSDDAIYSKGMLSDPILITGINKGELFGYTATNSALFLSDVLPGGPILEWNFEAIDDEPVAPIVKPGNISPVSPLKEVVGTLSSLGIMSDTFEFGDIDKDVAEIQNTKIKSYNLSIIESKGINSIDLSKVVDSIEYDGEEVKIIYLTDVYPYLKNVTKINRVGNKLQVSDGKGKWELSYTGGKIKSDILVEPKIEGEVKGTVVMVSPSDIIQGIIKTLEIWEDDDEYKDAIATLRKSAEEGYLYKWMVNASQGSPNFIAGSEKFKSALNNLIKNYKESEDALELLSEAISSEELLSKIIEANKSNCSIIG